MTAAVTPAYRPLEKPLGNRWLTFRPEEESSGKRFLYVVLALVVTTLFYCMLMRYFAAAPGIPGIDENAYLVGGKNLAASGTPGMTLPSPFSYVGTMWIRTPSGWYYPKYPAGTPLLNAIAIWLGGANGKFAAFYVAPICSTLAVLGMFFLTRAIAGSFLGLMGMIILATNANFLWFASIPGSHAPSMCFAIWGMFLLLQWWKSGSITTGILAGLAVGYTFTTRYSEGLLILPLLAAAISTVRYNTFTWLRRGIWAGIFAALVTTIIIVAVKKGVPLFIFSWDLAAIVTDCLNVLSVLSLGFCLGVLVFGRWATILRALVPVLAWTFVVGGLLLFNFHGSGHLTGYDSTSESTGFTVSEFMSKWEFTAQELYMYGLFLVFPLGLMGLVLMFQRNSRMALTLTLWFVPGTLLYTSYYWGNQMQGPGFLRFFLTLFPPMIASAMWLLASAAGGAFWAKRESTGVLPSRGKIALPIGAGILTAATAATGLYIAAPILMTQYIHNANLEFSARQIVEVIPCRAEKGKPTPVVFADMSVGKSIFPQLLMYMQFVGDCDWYSPNSFMPKGGGTLAMMGLVGQMGQDNKDNKAQLFDPEQKKFLDELYKMSREELVTAQNNLIFAALDSGRPVYTVLEPGMMKLFTAQFLKDKFETKRLVRWQQPLNPDDESKDSKAPNESNGPGKVGLGPPRMAMGFFDSGSQTLEIWQITRKPVPASAPATATAPATQAK